MGRNLTQERQEELERCVFDCIRTFTRKDTPIPYLVLDSHERLSTQLSYLFALQILKTCSNLLLALSPDNRSNSTRQRRAKNKYSRYAVNLPNAPPLLLYETNPPVVFDKVRLSCETLHIFINDLRHKRFTNQHILFALTSLLQTLSHCQINYNDSTPHITLLTQPVLPKQSDIIMASPSPLLTFAPSLPTFTGSKDENVEEFISRLDRLLAAYSTITWEQKLFYLENQCRAGPLKLIQRELQYLADHPDPNRTPEKIYKHIHTTLKDSYNIQLDAQSYRDELQSRVKKDNESFQDYIQSVLDLCSKAQIRHLSDKLSHLHKGLPFNLATNLRPNTDYTNVPTFLQAVQKLDATQKATIRAHTQSALISGAYPAIFNPFLALSHPTQPISTNLIPQAVPSHAPNQTAPTLPSLTPPLQPAQTSVVPHTHSVQVAPSQPAPCQSADKTNTDALLNTLVTQLSQLLQPKEPSVSVLQPDQRQYSRSSSPSNNPHFQQNSNNFQQNSNNHPQNPTNFQQNSNNSQQNSYPPRFRNNPNYQNNNPRYNYQNTNYGQNNRNYQHNNYNQPRANPYNNQPNSAPPRYNNNYNRNHNNNYNNNNNNYNNNNNNNYNNNYNNNNNMNRRPPTTNPSYRRAGPPQHYTTSIYDNRSGQSNNNPAPRNMICNFCSGNHPDNQCRIQSALNPKN